MKEESKSLKDYVDECLRKNFGIADFAALCEAIHKEDVFSQHFGVIGMRKLLSGGI